MDNATIIKLFETQEKTIGEIIKANGTAIRATMKSEVDLIHIMDKQRNNKIGKNEADVIVLKKETTFFRWCHRNPGKTITVLLIILAGLYLGFGQIDFKRTIENKTGVIIRSDEPTYSNRPGR